MADIMKDGGYNALPIAYQRGNPIPLDTTAVWYNEDDLKEYATTTEEVTAYVGQIVTLVDEASNNATSYIIKNKAGDLKPVGESIRDGEGKVHMEYDSSLKAVKFVFTEN